MENLLPCPFEILGKSEMVLAKPVVSHEEVAGCRMTNSSQLPGTILALALKILCPGKPLSSGQMRMVGYPRVVLLHQASHTPEWALLTCDPISCHSSPTGAPALRFTRHSRLILIMGYQPLLFCLSRVLWPHSSTG